MAIINFWIMLSPAADPDLRGVAKIVPLADNAGAMQNPVSVDSVQFPLFNLLTIKAIKLLRNYPERDLQVFPAGLWNCYASGEGLHEFVTIREQFQNLDANYLGDFKVVGCWDYATGEPVGGVGSPWFTTPPELADIMPGVPQPGPGGDPTSQPEPELVFGVLQDIVLGAGQAPRKFV